MSAVPAAVSKVSENPPANAVTHTIGEKQKKADVDRKIRFYGVIEAFRQGRMPDNRQIDETLRYVQAKSPVKIEDLSDDGKKLVHDFRAIIDTAREMVLEKNANEEVQNFIYASRKSSVADKAGVNPSISKEDAKKDAQNAGQAFETIIKLFLRNGEFRKLIEDAGVIGRDVFADAAVKTSELARPDEDRLANVDQPAPEGEFHDDIPQGLKPKTQEEKEAAQAEKEAEKARAKVRAQQAADKMDPNDPTSQGNQQVAQQKAIEQKNALLNKIPDEHRERIAEHKDKTIDYMKEKFPEERRDQFIYRLKKVLVECQRHRDWQDSMSFILNAFETYKGHAADIHDQALDSSKNVRGEGNVASAETAFRTLIERFANGRPTQPLLNAVDQIYTDVKNDPELRDWFKRLDSYVRRALLEPGYVMKDEADRDAKQLQQSGKKFFVAAEPGQQQGKYKPHVDQIWDELTTFTDGFAKDPLNQKFGRQWKNLFNDLIYDESGKPEFKSHLLSDIMQTILPELLVSVSYVPLPRIEYTDSEVDLVIENIAAAPINLLPNIIEFETNNYVKASAFKGIDSRHKHSFTLTLSQIHLEMRDVFFQMNKKSGFKTKQSGFADIFLGGKGLSVVAQIEGGNEPRGRRSRNVFVVKDVKATIDTLDFAVRKSKHDTLIKLLRPLAKSIAKKQIAKAAEGGIRQALEQLNRQLTDARNTAYDAEPGSKMDAVKAKAQREKEDKQRKAEANAPKGTFKVPTSKRESVLPNLGTKEGWINKLDERAELAKQSGKANKDWHSPAFNIVDASGLPKDGYNAKTGDSHKGRNAALGAAGVGAAGAGAAGLANKSSSNNNVTRGGTIPTGAAHVPSGTTSSSTAGQQQQYAQPQQQQYQQQYAQPQQQSSGAAGLPLAGAGLVGGAGGLAAGSHGQSQQPQQAGAIPAGAGYGSAGAYNQQPSSVAGGNFQGGEMPASTTNFGASPLTAPGQGQGQQQSSGGYSGAAPALNNAVQSNSIQQNSGLVHDGRQ